jgi:hypothetical protein
MPPSHHSWLGCRGSVSVFSPILLQDLLVHLNASIFSLVHLGFLQIKLVAKTKIHGFFFPSWPKLKQSTLIWSHKIIQLKIVCSSIPWHLNYREYTSVLLSSQRQAFCFLIETTYIVWWFSASTLKGFLTFGLSNYSLV